MEFYALLVLLSAVSADNFQPVNFVYEHTVEKQFMQATLNRTRREESDIPNCCGKKSFSLDHLVNDLKNCASHFTKKGADQRWIQDLYCTAMCLTKSYGIVDDDGEIYDIKLKEFVQESFDEEIEDVIDEAVDKCIEQANEKSPKGCKSKCDTRPVYVYLCVIKEIIE
ncbi:hypothetical protein L9F63_017282, partial [Diploptera punctata]